VKYNPKDPFYRKAKSEGYRSRAAYKLLELNARFRIVRAGDRVVDLGAAPGGWLQVASKLVGPKGLVIGVDTQPIAALPGGNAVTIQGDITDPEVTARMRTLLGAPADAVLSDLSPRLTGIAATDASRAAELNRMALHAAAELLKVGGCFVVKAFVGEETEVFFKQVKTRFQSVRRTRPDATRKGSSEVYLIAKSFSGPTAEAGEDGGGPGAIPPSRS
jgi:23S rRNA (uridine2552-2'-O)-methyltransferase